MLAGMAAACVAEGYVNVRVDDIIEQARASRRTFYTYFDNREECMLAAHETILDDCLRAVDGGPQDPESAMRRLMEYLAAWPAHARLLLVEILAAGPRGADRHEAAVEHLAARLSECSGPLPEHGDLSAAQQRHAHFGALHMLVLQRVIRGQEHSLPRLTPALVALAARS
jgi:AcrR family transcriptional regulator